MFNDKQPAVSSSEQQRVGQLEIQSAIVEDVYRASATIKAKTVAMCHAWHGDKDESENENENEE